MLTKTEINKLTPTDKCKPNRPDSYADGDGLYLLVKNTGNKSWLARYYWQGKQKNYTIGKYPLISPQEARSRNLELKRLVEQGIDPKQQKKITQATQDGSLIFDKIANDWLEVRKAKGKKTYENSYNRYRKDIKPVIGHKNINDVTRDDIRDVGDRAISRGSYKEALRVVRTAGYIFTYADEQRITSHNPTHNITKSMPKGEKERHQPTIDIKELPQLLEDMSNYKGNILVKLGLWFICYVFLRTKEVRFLEWADIDFKANVIRMPADKMKAKRKHIVPIAPAVKNLLLQIKEMELSQQYVFVNPNTGSPYSSHVFIKALYDMGYKGKHSVHGYRRLASTILHEQGYKHEAIEIQLAHDKESKISKAYDGSQYLEERIIIMNAWAEYIDKVHSEGLGNVIRMPKRADKQGTA